MLLQSEIIQGQHAAVNRVIGARTPSPIDALWVAVRHFSPSFERCAARPHCVGHSCSHAARGLGDAAATCPHKHVRCASSQSGSTYTVALPAMSLSPAGLDSIDINADLENLSVKSGDDSVESEHFFVQSSTY